MSRFVEGDPDCPRKPGEGAISYVRRLAIHLGYKVGDEPVRGMPKAEKPYLEVLRDIWEPPSEPGERG